MEISHAQFRIWERQEPRRAPSRSSPPSTSRRSHRRATAESNIAVLGPTLRFKGELSAEEDFILQGRIEGSINHTRA